MNPREQLVRRQALRALDACRPWMMGEELLRDAVNIVLMPSVPQAELRRALDSLEADCFIRRFGFGREVKIKITDEGRAEIA